MRVLIVTEHYWPEQFRITDIARGLKSRGHEVDVLAAMPNYPRGRYYDGYWPWGPLEQRHEGVRILRVPVVPRRGGRGWELLVNYGSFVLASCLRIAFGRSQSWDVALVLQLSPVTTALPALLLRALKGVPVAIWVQDLWPETLAAVGVLRKGPFFSAARWLSHSIYRSCDSVIGQSRAFLARLGDAGVRSERLSYVPNWADDIFSSAKARSDEGGMDGFLLDGFNVVFAGNLGRAQALETVLMAATLLREDAGLRWIFLGEGVRGEWMKDEVKRLRIEHRVAFMGHRPVETMPFYFGRAGALLVSLKADDVMAMTVPSKLQSYLAAGRPILASLDGEGARVVEEAGAGLTSPAGDALRLAENVRLLKDMNPDERERMAQSGREYYESHFRRETCLGNIEDTLRSLAKEAKR